MEQCKYCSNNEECHKNSWCVTMDRCRKFLDGNWVCDNFKTTKNIIILQEEKRLSNGTIHIK